MEIRMNHNNDLAGFIGGFFTTGIYTATILPANFYQDAFAKIIVTVVVSLIGGIIGMAGKDIYTQWLQPKVKRLIKKLKK
jgi:hypothetical protein